MNKHFVRAMLQLCLHLELTCWHRHSTWVTHVLFVNRETTQSIRVHTVYLELWLSLAEEENTVTAFPRYFQLFCLQIDWIILKKCGLAVTTAISKLYMNC